MLELLAGAALRSLFLAAAVGTGLRLRRTCNPHVSLAAWTIVLAASLLMPAAMRLTSSAALPVGHLPFAAQSIMLTEAPSMTLDAIPSVPALAPAADMRWRELAAALYLAVFSALMVRVLVGLSLSWRIVRAATPISEPWASGFDVRASRRIDAPATFGSVILLPGDHAGWTPARRLAVLAHEGAHVARRDFAIQLVAVVNRAVFWFNPFSWWLRRHLSDLAEAASDDAAIARLGDRCSYAEILLEISGRVSRLPGAISMARHADVASRIERILSESPLPAGMSRRGRAMLAACIVPPAVLLSFLIILPASLPELPLSVESPGSVAIVADDAATEGVDGPVPSHVPTIVAVDMAPPSPTPVQVTDVPIGPSPASATRGEVASIPLPPTSSPPPRSSVAVPETPRNAPHLMAKTMLNAQTSRTVRPLNRSANNQGGLNQSPGAETIKPVAASYSTNRSASEGGQSPLFKRIANETCRGTYTGQVTGAYGAEARFQPVQARFWRGPGDAPWVTFRFAAQNPADLPVTIKGSEIQFTGTYGMTYTLLPSRAALLPPRYHRLTGSAADPAGGTIDFACEEAKRPL